VIEDYSFGQVKIEGKVYKHDLIVFQDQVSSWWRVTGHQVVKKDIEALAEQRPEIIIFGMGSSGLMKVTPEVKDYLHQKDIEFLSIPTKEATLYFNQLLKEKKVAGAFHLTC